MWWNAIIGLKVYFQNPWIWVFFLGLPLFYFFYLLIIRHSTQSAHLSEGAGPGCLVQILGLFIQSFGIALFILWILPILLGQAQGLSWQAVEPYGFVAVRAGLFAMILVTLASFFPILGNILGSFPGLETFLLSTLTFRLMSPLYLENLLGKSFNIKLLFPPWWLVLSLFILSWILCRLLMFLVNYFGNKFKLTGMLHQRGYQWWVQGLGPSVDILGGILPFLIYARYVAESLP